MALGDVYEKVGATWTLRGNISGPQGPTGAGGSDATTSSKGIVQLAGDLTGTAASPQIAAGVITDADVATANKDGAVGTASMRTIGTGALQALAGNTRLDQLTVPTAAVGLNGQKITSLADPTAATDAANKQYVDNAISAAAKPPVWAASTANVNIASDGSPSGFTIDGQVFNGAGVGTRNRVLLKNQTTTSENGVYVVTGSAGSAQTMARATDMDNMNEFPGALVIVEAGTTNADTAWLCTTDPVAGSTIVANAWTQFHPVSAPDATTSTKGIVQLAGDLAGTAASPQIAAGVITDADVNSANKDGAVGVASMRTLGSGALQALAGNTRLDQIAAPTASVSLNGQTITNLGTPSATTDAATKSYVDSAVGGTTQLKSSVRVASTANITLGSNISTAIDGVGPFWNTGDSGTRVLLKNQTNATENGIYTVSNIIAGSSYRLTNRATDMDVSAEFPAAHVFVEQGTTQADTGWLCTNDAAAFTLGSTNVTWVQFTGVGALVDGIGLLKTGNTLDVRLDGTTIEAPSDILQVKDGGITNAKLAGSIDLTTKVTGALPVANGGTGQTTAKAARETGLGSVGYYSSATHGAGTTITVTQATHGLRASRGLMVQVQDETTGAVEYPDIVVAASGDVTVTYAASVSANAKRVTVIG